MQTESPESVRDHPASPSSLAVETKGLTKSFGKRVVVDSLDISIPSAGVAAFVGPNGAGKSTTLRMLLGLLYPTSGTARVLNGDIRQPDSYLPKVGALIEGPAFYPALSGRANLKVLHALGGLKNDNISEILELVGLDRRGEDRVGRYSLGMKQRLGVAAALLPEPALLVLDEPANGLDPTGIAAMRTLLRAVADTGVTVLVSSHQLAELQHISDWVVLINQGRLKFQGPMTELLTRRTSLFVKPDNPQQTSRLIEILKSSGYEPTDSTDGHLVIDGGLAVASAVNQIAMNAGIVLCELRSGQSSLEDAYFEMTDGGSVA
ncbi:MAG: ABC transporter ATP-binding protein [Actinomycetota bacterium]